jgi:antitoxin (DNA-binding transcriptional repressor) of toxin-antitoxin stability system/predicted RNase H-like HicB family nuclease
MTKQYLKDIVALAGGTLTARIEAIGLPEQNKNGKYFRKVNFVFPATGKSMEEGVFEFNFEKALNGVKIGDTVEITLKDGWPVYRLLSATAETATVQPSQSSFQQVKSERAATEAINERDEKQEQKSIEISLQGIFQALLIQGKTMKEALDMATEARAMIIQRAGEIRLGLHNKKEPVKVMPSPEAVAAVNAVVDTPPLPNSPADYE